MKERENSRNRGGEGSGPWRLEWPTVEAAEREELTAISMARPVAVLGILVALAALLPTLVGTSVIMSLTPTSEIGVATGAAGLAIAVVPAALLVPTPTRAAFRFAVLTAALLSAGAAAIHFVVIDMHLMEWWGFAGFFVATGVAQLGWALAAMWRPTRALFWIGAFGNGLIVVTWVVSRTVGMPFGPDPWKPEVIGFADVIATAFEVGLVGLCVALAVGRPTSGEAERPRPARTCAVVLATIVLTALSLISAIGAATTILPPSA